MKRLILTQQQLADAYAVPVKSSIYQYFLGLSDRKEKMIGLIIGEYEFFDDGDIEYKEHDFKETAELEQRIRIVEMLNKEDLIATLEERLERQKKEETPCEEKQSA